jgi:two-component system, NtrC family, sensor kinase
MPMTGSAILRSLKGLGLAAVLAPGVLFGAYAWASYHQVFRDAESRAAHLAAILQEHALRAFEAVQLALRLADQHLDGLDWETIASSRPLWEELRRIQQFGPQIGSIFVVSPDGDSPLTTRVFPAPQVDFSDRDYFVAHKDKDAGLYLGQAYVGKISDAPIFNFSIRRSGTSGFNGVVGSSLYVPYFQNFYASVGDPRDSFAVALLRQDGDVLVRHPTFTVGARFSPAVIEQIRGSEQRTVDAVSPLDGVRRHYAVRKIGQFPAYIAYSIEHNSIRKRWEQGLIVPGTLAAGFTLALLALTTVALRRARAERVAVGQLEETAVSLQQEIEGRRRAEASLLQAQRLDAVGQMTGGIAHDFNNLLTVILGNIDLAQRGGDPARLQRLLKSARYAAERGASLVRQLLAFSRGQELHPKVVDLNDVLADTGSLMRRAVSEAIEFELDCAPGLWPTRIDVAEFEAALLNLAVNARDAMQGRGRLVLRTRNVSAASDEKCSGALKPGDYVVLSVIDNGAGMPPDVLARVYEPFFTTKEVGKGSGLGLSQVHGFVRQSGGDIAIESKMGRGTTVRLYLPRCEPAPPVAEEARPERTSAATVPQDRQQIVLVVEDDREVRKISMGLLDELGYATIGVRDGLEALAVLSAGGAIDVLLTDLVLPRGVDGTELVTRALELRPGLAVLITTAAPEGQSEHPTLRKPFTKEQLADCLRHVRERSVGSS